MDEMEILKPNVSDEMAKELVKRLYGLEVTSIKHFVSYDDQNFHIKVSESYDNPYVPSIDPQGYTLKITNTQKSSQKGHFALLHNAMIYAGNRGLRTPMPVKNLEGNTWKMLEVTLKNEETQQTGLCGIHMLTFITGVNITTLEYDTDILFQWGTLLASFHNIMQDFDCPELHRSVLWNLENIFKIKSCMTVLDSKQKKLVSSVLDKYTQYIQKNYDALPKGPIHGDLNENNTLGRVNPERDGFYIIDGVLDYEDVHYGTYAWDVGVMLAYALLDCNNLNPLEGAGHALAGYLDSRSLSDVEMGLLKICIELRLCQSLVYGLHSFSSDPTNIYLLDSQRTGWKKLELICSIENEDLLLKWKTIKRKYEQK